MLRGYQFDRSKVTAIDDANLFSALNKDGNYVIRGRGEGMEIVTEGLNITVKTGSAVIQGRFIELVESEALVMPLGARRELVITIDLTQINVSTEVDGVYESINNQLKIELVENIIQDDLHNGGLIYMLHLATVRSVGNVALFEKNLQTYREVVSGAPILARDFDNLLESGTYAGSSPSILKVDSDTDRIVQTYSTLDIRSNELHEVRRMYAGNNWSGWASSGTNSTAGNRSGRVTSGNWGMEWGTITVPTTANTAGNFEVQFNDHYQHPPDIQLQMNGTAPQIISLGVSIVSTGGFGFTIHRTTGSGNVIVNWSVVGGLHRRGVL